MSDDSTNLSGRARRAVGRRVRSLSGAGDPPPTPTANASGLTQDEQDLLDSPLFDHEWYARVARKKFDRLQAVRHFLRAEPDARLLPHPLFDPAYFTEQYDDDIEDRNPLLVYLRRRVFRVPTHPLFDTAGYLKRNEDARGHERGPIGHYLEVGAPQRLPVSRWLPTDEDGGQDDLVAWIEQRAAEWHQRRRALPRIWSERPPQGRVDAFATAYADADPPPGDMPLVTVVVAAGRSAEHLTTTLRTLAGQSLDRWEAIVLSDGQIPDLADLCEQELAGRHRLIQHPELGAAAATEEAIRSADSPYVAFLDAGDQWHPDRLRVLVTAMEDRGWKAACDIVEGVSPDGGTRFAHGGQDQGAVTSRIAIELPRVVARTEVLRQVAQTGGFAPDRPGAWRFGAAVRLLRLTAVEAAYFVGIRREFRARAGAHRRPPSLRPVPDHEHVEAWSDVVLNDTMIDWDSLASRQSEPGLVSVIIPTFKDWSMTLAAVRSVLASAPAAGGAESEDPARPDIECIVWDNGSDVHTSVVLDAMALKYPDVTLVHSPVNHGFALGNNLAVPHARGETVMFLNNDTQVPPDWLVPIQKALSDPEVLGAQSLLLYPSGGVQSAGVAFPSTGGLPHAFLQGFPIEDAAHVGQLRFAALTGAALALRYADVVAMRGFDPVFTNGMEDIDLCQRLAATRPGHYRVVTEQPVIHFESKTQGRYAKYMLNREVYLGRWSGVDEPRDDVALWASAGLRVVDHQVHAAEDWQKRRLIIPNPVMVREALLHVSDRPRPLRWAIKNPAPFGPESEKWGDTHFARAVASALRARGQEVVIDHRGEFERRTSRHDDVALVLRGLAPFRSTPEQISIGWVISHPEMLGRQEAVTYDRLLGASISWSAQASQDWGIPVEPLLQATDPDHFHPDRAHPDTGHPVLFVGSSRKTFRPIVRDAVEAGLPLSVYGDLWGRFIPKKYVKAKYLPNTEVGAAYRSAGVVLNDHWEDMRVQGFISNRLFDAVASGARVVSDRVEGIDAIFGDSVQVWETPEDLVRLTSTLDLDEIYGSDEARRERADLIAREHSFGARADRLIEIAREQRHARGFDDGG